MPMPSPHQALIVGYRDDDVRRYGLGCTQPGGLMSGYCVDCKHKVYLDPGAQRTIRDREAVVCCMFCNDHYRYVERVSQQGIVTQL